MKRSDTRSSADESATRGVSPSTLARAGLHTVRGTATVDRRVQHGPAASASSPRGESRKRLREGRPRRGLAHHLPPQIHDDSGAPPRSARALPESRGPSPAPHIAIHMRSSTTRARSVSRAHVIRRERRAPPLPPRAPRPAQARFAGSPAARSTHACAFPELTQSRLSINPTRRPHAISTHEWCLRVAGHCELSLHAEFGEGQDVAARAQMRPHGRVQGLRAIHNHDRRLPGSSRRLKLPPREVVQEVAAYLEKLRKHSSRARASRRPPIGAMSRATVLRAAPCPSRGGPASSTTYSKP